MKLGFYFIMSFVMSLTFATVAFASEQIGDIELISGLLELAKELKGAPTMVLVGGLIQAFLLFSKHSWSKLLGRYKLLLVSIASFAGIFVTGLAQGLTFAQIIGDGATLTAFQVLVHQVIKQVQKRD